MKIRLKVLSGSCAAKKLSRPDGRYYIGTGDQCHFQIRDEQVSAQQCSLRVRKARIVLETLSHLPTLVNGHAVTGRCELFDGDVLTVGDTRFCLLLADHSENYDPLAGEVTEWLSKEDEKQRLLRELDPTIRRLDLPALVGDSESNGQQKTDVSAHQESGEQQGEAAVAAASAKRAPQKLPPRPAPPPAPSSHEAASQVLTQIFSRTPRDKRN